MDVGAIGRSGLTGWRRKVGEPVARELARRTALTPDKARTLVGLAFVAASAAYLARTLVAVRRRQG